MFAFFIYVGAAQAQPTWSWADREGDNSSDFGAKVAADPSNGDVYVTGYVMGNSFSQGGPNYGAEDIFLAKYDAGGALQWVTKCGGGGLDIGEGIAFHQGSVYVAGTFTGSATFKSAGTATTNQPVTSNGGQDAFLARYDTSGALQWVTIIGAVGSTHKEEVNSVAVDQAGDVYVVGIFQGPTTRFFSQPGTAPPTGNLPVTGLNGAQLVFVAKYTSAGVFSWARAATSSGPNVANSVAVNAAGTVFVTGGFKNSLDFGGGITLSNPSASRDAYLAAYDGAGNIQWAKQTTGTGIKYSNGVATDMFGDVYITGEFEQVATFSPAPAHTFTSIQSGGSYTLDTFIAKYDDATGGVQWVRREGGNGEDFSYGICFDGRHMVTAGFFQSTASFGMSTFTSAGLLDTYVARYELGSGTPYSALQASGTGDEAALGIAAKGYGVVYVTGVVTSATANFGATALNSSAPSEDFFLAKVDWNFFLWGHDLFIKDAANDFGSEPDVQAGLVLWASPDIWVRNSPDTQIGTNPPRYANEHSHQNPEYAAISSNAPWIYVKGRNRSTGVMTGTMNIYWANGSTALDWPLNWTPVTPPGGIFVLSEPGMEWVVAQQWTNIPTPGQSTNGHFCLLARFVGVSPPDPMYNEVSGLGVGIWGNVYNSNNIAWKNVTVVDNILNNRPGRDTIDKIFVRNIYERPTMTKLSFVTNKEEFAQFIRHGAISINLGKELFERWRRGGQAGGGVKPLGGTLVGVLSPDAWMGNILLDPNQQETVEVRFRLKGPPPASMRKVFNFDLIQYAHGRTVNGSAADKAQLIGGERYTVDLRQRTRNITVNQAVRRSWLKN